MTTRPESIWCPSPNFKASTAARGISCVVLHATATRGLDSPKAHLCDPAAKVSAHYLIDLDGTIYHLVHESNIAWHAGESVWKGKEWVNNFSVGIEMVNANDGAMAYPEAQLAACAALVAAICKEHEVKLEDVIGHVDIVAGKTPEEKAERLKLHNDPRGFPWENFRARLGAAGIA